MTVGEALRRAVLELKAAALENPAFEARLLVMEVTGLTRTELITREAQELTKAQASRLKDFLKKRAQGVPFAYLAGHREFWSLDLKVTEDTLIPRPDTETLVEEALKLDFKSVLDLGTGTGAIILALKKEKPEAYCCAVDLNPKTLKVAQENAALNHLAVDFRQGSWFEPLEDAESFDLIVSNPPYIEEDDPHLKENGLNFEPQGALISGADGLDDLKVIIAGAGAHLKPQGSLLVEHGYQQGEAVRALFAAALFTEIRTVRDLGGNERVTGGCFPGSR